MAILAILGAVKASGEGWEIGILLKSGSGLSIMYSVSYSEAEGRGGDSVKGGTEMQGTVCLERDL